MTDPITTEQAREIARRSMTGIQINRALCSLADQLDLYKHAEKVLEEHGIVLWQKPDGKTFDGFGFTRFQPYVNACAQRDAQAAEVARLTKELEMEKKMCQFHELQAQRIMIERNAAVKERDSAQRTADNFSDTIQSRDARIIELEQEADELRAELGRLTKELRGKVDFWARCEKTFTDDIAKVVNDRPRIEAELAKEKQAIDDALMAMRQFARDNPHHYYNGERQDPCGVHAWLALHDPEAKPTADAKEGGK